MHISWWKRLIRFSVYILINWSTYCKGKVAYWCLINKWHALMFSLIEHPKCISVHDFLQGITKLHKYWIFKGSLQKLGIIFRQSFHFDIHFNWGGRNSSLQKKQEFLRNRFLFWGARSNCSWLTCKITCNAMLHFLSILLINLFAYVFQPILYTCNWFIR